MRTSKRSTAYGLLMLLVLLALKSLLPYSASTAENCDEFAHIHRYKIHLSAQNTSAHESLNADDENRDHRSDADKECHAAQSVFTYSTLPQELILNPYVVPRTSFALIFEITHRFASPYLDPLRRPPRA
jgi:hypothetical protein